MVELTTSQRQPLFIRELLFNAGTILLMGVSFVFLEHFFSPTKNSTSGTYPFAFMAFILLLANYSRDRIDERGLKNQLLMGVFIVFSAWLINLVMYGLSTVVGFSHFEHFQLKQSLLPFLGIYLVLTPICLSYNWIGTTSFGVAVKRKWSYISELKWLNYLLAFIVLGGGLFIGIYAYVLTH